MMQEMDLCDSLTNELDTRTTIIQSTSEPQNEPSVPEVLLGMVVLFSHATLQIQISLLKFDCHLHLPNILKWCSWCASEQAS